ncbi:MAG TPA: hypothetical protein P5081_14875 [Phycisphaerae bacterium]|nr:hypothetical protein [Phycisphaerae bacterium]HRW54153.1 hypothetical protein [Phycisphaerae bacterium]
MFAHRVKFRLMLLLALALPTAPLLASAETPETTLHRAYFTENIARDYETARSLYDQAAESDLSDELRRVARVGSDRCRDHIAAADFSTLMPSDTLVFAELRRPGELIAALSGMLGMTPDSMRDLLDQRPDSASGAPINIPSRIAISPTLLDAVSAFGGAAVGLTDIDFSGRTPPHGVVVIHHGDVKLVKGLLETAFQFAPTAEKIADLPTFQTSAPDIGNVTGVLTEGLIIIGNDRGLVQGAADRLIGGVSDSLRAREDLQEVFAERGDRMFFAFGDLTGIYKLAKSQVHERDRDDLAVANTMLDLDHLRWATLSFGADRGALGMTARVCYADDHRSIVYNMLRLPAMSRDSMRYVPADAAAVLGLGLNPALAHIAAGRAEDSTDVTGFDIPREIFGNIRELSAFVVPGPAGHSLDGRDPIPNAAVVIASNDVVRSRTLWNEMLRIPGLTVESGPVEPSEFELGGQKVTSYFIPELGKVYMTQVDDCLSIGLTRRAIADVIEAHAKKRSVLDDESMGTAFARLPDSAGILMVGHVGRLAEVGGAMGEPEVAMISSPAARLCRNTTFWLGVGQSRTQLTLTGALTGLPNVNEAIAMFGPLIHGRESHATRQRVERAHDAEATARVERRQEESVDVAPKEPRRPLR